VNRRRRTLCAQFSSVLAPHYAAHGGVEYSSRTRRAFPRTEGLLFAALVALVALAYVLLTAESAPYPVLTILAPAANTTMTEESVTVLVQALHADRFLEERGYHLHYYLDVEPPTDPNRPALTSSSSCFSTDETAHVWTLVGSGWHRLSVQLVRANDTPLSPAVTATVNVRVPASTSAAGAAPLRPGSSAPSPSKPGTGGGC